MEARRDGAGVPSFFIVTCGRSGSTSLARILDAAPNGRCAVEPGPDLNRACRDAIDGRLAAHEIDAILRRDLLARVVRERESVEVYGEKHLTYGPFLGWIAREIPSRFVFLCRDGRDVVTSFVNWHDHLFGEIYRECREAGALSSRAIAAASGLLAHLDTSDQSRPRPREGEACFESWETLSRAEMCAYYWSRMNRLHASALAELDAFRWRFLDYTSARGEDLESLLEFLELRSPGRDRIDELIARRINSLEERVGDAGRFPRWTDWDSGERDRFEALAGDAMRELGYFGEDRVHHWRPERGEANDSASRSGGEPLAPDELQAIQAAGVELDRLRASDRAPRTLTLVLPAEGQDAFRAGSARRITLDEIWRAPTEERADLVLAPLGLDTSHDIDAFLSRLASLTSGRALALAAEGWWPELVEHRYAYDARSGSFRNRVSPARARRTLESLGAREIEITPIAVDRGARGYATRIAWRAPG